MKQIQSNTPSNRMTLAAISVAFLFICSTCSTKVPFQISSVVPSAEGSVDVKRDKNSNYNIQLEVIRLAEPERLDPPMATYVVWVDTENDGAKRIGNLTTSSGTFSSAMKSSLETVTSYKPTRIFITAETDREARYPGMVVLTTAPF